jgi:hypothetical protein
MLMMTPRLTAQTPQLHLRHFRSERSILALQSSSHS